MIDLEPARQQLRADLGHRRPSLTWAKLEILFGLLTAGLGQVAFLWWARPGMESEWLFLVAGLALFALGGYLALAGHRSHLYHAANERAAYLLDQMRRLKNES